jgi:hypothetical protein
MWMRRRGRGGGRQAVIDSVREEKEVDMGSVTCKRRNTHSLGCDVPVPVLVPVPVRPEVCGKVKRGIENRTDMKG